MADALYTKDILRLASDIPHHARLDAPDASVTKVSPICGSRVDVDVALEDGVVTGFGQRVRACALGQAAAAIMGEAVIGQPLERFPALREEIAAFLKGSGAPPKDAWQGMAIFSAAQDYKSRHASILLTFDAMADIAAQQQKA